ncbi:MarR family winged helix-turn-helix transcriptional regulator [Streptomyces hawaiiensis]|uniref:MarR family winged helix-turn-helix transcriptional regulator n=1 Tax=Streptomyces hawaiiensis TaxID=67305 RepID=UPI003647DCE7
MADSGRAERLTQLDPASTRAQERLGDRVSRHLQSDSHLSVAAYAVLVHLADTPGGRMLSADLAASVGREKSRTSHQLSRMVKRGLVVREGCPEGGRGAFGVTTPEGREMIEAAAPAMSKLCAVCSSTL